MDPYLEDPAHWPDVHHELISCIREHLSALIRPRYVARVEERTYFPEPDDPAVTLFIPDVRVEHTGRRGVKSTSTTATITAPIETITMLDGEFREARVEIVEVASRQVVTVIEVVSPSNKVVGSAGRRSFVAKRLEIMNSPAHWVEIDLLRGDTSLDPLVLNRLRPHDYYVHASKAEERPRGKVWLIPLEQPLPTVGVPLRSPDADAPLDLQSVLATAYDRAGYDLTIDYRRPPVPPLSKAQAKWAKTLFGKGQRK
jgi:hypothetical protein